MALKEQQEIKYKAYVEAQRYIENAKEVLQKAKKEDDFYNDPKYVRMACGTAYSGVLLALDAYLQLKDVEMPKKKRRSIEFYTSSVAQLDKKLLLYLNSAYQVLHLSGYYDGIRDARVVKIGFENAEQVISRIKPDYLPELPPEKPSLLKRVYSFLFL